MPSSSELVRLPHGVVVRVRLPEPFDDAAVERLLHDRDVTRIGRRHRMPPEYELLAESTRDHRLVGHAAFWPARDGRADAAVAVRPEWRGAGLAVELLARVAERADALHVPTLMLDI